MGDPKVRRILEAQADPGGLGIPEEAPPDPGGLPLHIARLCTPLISEHPAATVVFLYSNQCLQLTSWRGRAPSFHQPRVIFLSLTGRCLLGFLFSIDTAWTPRVQSGLERANGP